MPLPPSDAVTIPAGDCLMGCVPADRRCEAMESPRHRVTISKPYRMARTETTIAQYRRFIAATSYQTAAQKRGQGRFWRFDINERDWIAGLDWQHPFAANEVGTDAWPVVQVAWPDADAYCRWAGGRLPTEAEWERAARDGRDGEIHAWGNADLPLLNGVPQANGPDANTAREFATFATLGQYDDGYSRMAPVGRFPANGFLHDIAGNVYEWTAEWIADAPYPAGDAVDPKGLGKGDIKSVMVGRMGLSSRTIAQFFPRPGEHRLLDRNIRISVRMGRYCGQASNVPHGPIIANVFAGL